MTNNKQPKIGERYKQLKATYLRCGGFNDSNEDSLSKPIHKIIESYPIGTGGNLGQIEYNLAMLLDDLMLKEPLPKEQEEIKVEIVSGGAIMTGGGGGGSSGKPQFDVAKMCEAKEELKEHIELFYGDMKEGVDLAFGLYARARDLINSLDPIKEDKDLVTSEPDTKPVVSTKSDNTGHKEDKTDIKEDSDQAVKKTEESLPKPTHEVTEFVLRTIINQQEQNTKDIAKGKKAFQAVISSLEMYKKETKELRKDIAEMKTQIKELLCK